MQEHGLFGSLPKQTETKNTITQPPPPQKKTQKREGPPCCISNNNPLFLVNVMFLCKLHLLLAIAVLCRKHSFWHSFCVSQIMTPLFETHSNNPFLEGGVRFWELPKFTVLPIFVVFLYSKNPESGQNNYVHRKSPFFNRALLNRGERNGGYATFVWQAAARTRATQMTHMPSLRPLSLWCRNEGSIRHQRVICMSQRKNVLPIKVPPIKKCPIQDHQKQLIFSSFLKNPFWQNPPFFPPPQSPFF